MTSSNLTFRPATREDLPAIVALLANDALGEKRENHTLPLPASYEAAFTAIDQDPNNELIVVDSPDQVVAGVLQLTLVPHITYQGGWRAQIEGVRVAANLRSSGIGKQLLLWAIGRAKDRGCHLVQLTSDKARPDAIRFYEGLGFVPSHEGMKLHLDASVDDSTTPASALLRPVQGDSQD
ncbi:GNAT family N-acetyltransferase [Arenimonas daejeonensis]|uniref:GNAT family N-acetyltransferase n=1 Tax=Arenimonas daejeonensis TaxID=370777 RepID=UPI0011BDB629|nr:GNAT family N-acetyltransferase [Arenimonas daejeonensis]